MTVCFDMLWPQKKVLCCFYTKKAKKKWEYCEFTTLVNGDNICLKKFGKRSIMWNALGG